MMKKLLILLLAVYTVSCGSGQRSSNPDLLKIAIPTEPISLTPFASNDTHSYRVRWQIFEHDNTYMKTSYRELVKIGKTEERGSNVT